MVVARANRSIQTDGAGIDLPVQSCPRCRESVLTRARSQRYMSIDARASFRLVFQSPL
jgi:hypothetical protein